MKPTESKDRFNHKGALKIMKHNVIEEKLRNLGLIENKHD